MSGKATRSSGLKSESCSIFHQRDASRYAAQRRASGAAMAEAEGRAEAIGGRLQDNVRLGTLPHLPRPEFLFAYSTSMR